MSQNNFERTVERRLAELEDRLRRSETAPRVPQPFQVLNDGRPFFGNGLVVGGGAFNELYEPFEIPAPQGLALTTGSSFDTIYIDASWELSAAPGASAIASYAIQWKKNGEDVPNETSTTNTFIHLEPLEPNTTYTVTVFGLSKNNRPGLSLVGTITTGGDGTVPAVPTFPAGPVIPGVQALHIKWNPNAERDVANGAGQYRVVVSTSSTLASPVSSTLVSGTNTYVADLSPSQSYYVGVAARDSSGNESALAQPPGGPWTPAALVSTDIAIVNGGGNVVRNSGFEDPAPAARWTWFLNGGSMERTTANSHGPFGNASWRIFGTGDTYVLQAIPTLQRGWYVLSGWVRGANIAKAGGSPNALGARLGFETVNGAIANFAVIGGLGTAYNGGVIGGLGTFDWKRVAVKFQVTSTSADLRLFAQRGGNGACTGECWWDEIQLEAGTTLTGYAPRPDEISSASISATEIADNAITTPKLAAGSVVAGKIAAESIGTDQLAANSIVAAKIAAGQITGTHVVANTITATNIAANAIVADKISANAVTTVKLAADAVTADKLAAVAIAVGKFIQSNSYNSGVSGWRIDGAGNAEFNAATIRGSTFIGGTINIAGRIFASPSDSAVHLAANVEIGANYSGTVYSGDTNWGLQVGNQSGKQWTHMRAYLNPGTNHEVGWYDASRSRLLLYGNSNADIIKPGPDGIMLVGKVNQQGDWATKALVLRNGWSNSGLDNRDHSGMSFHVEAWNLASILQVVGPNGPAIEARSADNAGWIPIKASAFLVNSQGEGKKNITTLPAGDGITGLRPVKFQRPASKPSSGAYKRSAAQKAYEDSWFSGFVVEEVAETHPHLVGWAQAESGPVPDSLDPMGLLAETVRSLQSLEDRVSELQSVVNGTVSD